MADDTRIFGLLGTIQELRSLDWIVSIGTTSDGVIVGATIRPKDGQGELIREALEDIVLRLRADAAMAKDETNE